MRKDLFGTIKVGYQRFCRRKAPTSSQGVAELSTPSRRFPRADPEDLIQDGAMMSVIW